MVKRLLYRAVVTAALLLFGSASYAQSDKNLTFVTAGQGGAWYAMGAGFSKLLTDAGIPTTSEVGAGGVGNVALVNSKKGDLGFTTTTVPPAAARGEDPFTERMTDVRGLVKLSQNIVHIVVAKDSGVRSITDLKGKKFATQPVGNVSREAFKAVLEAVGLREEDLALTRGSQGFGANEMKDRRIVGFTATTNPPSPAMSEIAQSLDVLFLPLSEQVFEAMKRANDGYVQVSIPANTYRGQSEPIHTVGTDLIVIVNKDLSDDVAYRLTKALGENLDGLRRIHASLGALTLKDLAQVSGVALHPGALKYFKEKGAL